MELFKESLTDLIPSPSNMYNTSSVATLPLAPLAYGHPPRPAVELSTTDTPICMQAQNNPCLLLFYSSIQSCHILFQTGSRGQTINILGKWEKVHNFLNK